LWGNKKRRNVKKRRWVFIKKMRKAEILAFFAPKTVEKLVRKKIAPE